MIALAVLNAMGFMLFVGVAGGLLFTLGWLLGPGRYVLDGAGRAVWQMGADLGSMAIAGVVTVAAIFVGDGNG